jgi:hypothetical protein
MMPHSHDPKAHRPVINNRKIHQHYTERDNPLTFQYRIDTI